MSVHFQHWLILVLSVNTALSGGAFCGVLLSFYSKRPK